MDEEISDFHQKVNVACILHAPVQLQTYVVFLQGKDKVNSFLALGDRYEGYPWKHMTPYMHALVYHVPAMLRRFRNIRKFSQSRLALSTHSKTFGSAKPFCNIAHKLSR